MGKKMKKINLLLILAFLVSGVSAFASDDYSQLEEASSYSAHVEMRQDVSRQNSAANLVADIEKNANVHTLAINKPMADGAIASVPAGLSFITVGDD